MGIVINSGTILRGSTVRSSYPGDNYLPYTTLLLNGNGANNANNNVFLDGSTNNFAITRNGNATQGTFSPFSKSGWSNYFDGTGDYLSVAENAALELGSSDFTIEFWYYPVAEQGLDALVTKGWPTVYGSFLIAQSFTAGRIDLFASTNGSSWDVADTVALGTGISLNAWHHVVMTRRGNTLGLFVDGVRGNTVDVTAKSLHNNTYNLTIGASVTGSNAANAYISNFRMVIGSSVYDPTLTTLTVPTAPLTAITNTSLLTCQSNRLIDNSTNNFTITKNGDTSVVAFSPFASTDDWNASVHSGSGYFDGTGDYLTLATGIPVPSTGTFTIEAWVYLTDTTEEAIWTQYSAGTAGRSSFRVSSGKLIFANAAASTVTTTASVPTNAWTHVAAVRDSSNNLMLFINGNLDVTSVSYTASIQQIAATIGSFSDTTSALSGYISNLRITNTAAYTSTFTPPTAPLTAIANTSLLLNFTNAGIYDATSKNDLETVGNAQISTSVSKFGGGSIAFDGTGDYLVSRYPTADMTTFGTGDFTIEMWIRFTNASTTPEMIFLDFRPGAGNQIAPMFYVLSNTVRYYVNGFDRITSATISSGQWYHLAVARSGTSTKMFIDGTQSGSTYTDSNNYISGASYPVIGAARDGLYGVDGYIDDLRITKGYARYTANFTPPERQLLGKA